MIIPNVWTNKKWSKPPTIYIYVDFHGYQGPILVSMWRTNQGHKLQWTRKHTQKKTLVIKPDFGQVSLIYFSDSAIKTQLNILEPLNLETKMIFIDVFPIKTSIYRWFCHYNLLLLINRRKNNRLWIFTTFHLNPILDISPLPVIPPPKKKVFTCVRWTVLPSIFEAYGFISWFLVPLPLEGGFGCVEPAVGEKYIIHGDV